jgi:hypothetical protein
MSSPQKRKLSDDLYEKVCCQFKNDPNYYGNMNSPLGMASGLTVSVFGFVGKDTAPTSIVKMF